METSSPQKNICNLTYLDEMMKGKKHLIIGMIDAFLTQIPDELNAIREAIERTDYANIKNYAHTMKSSMSIMGVSALTPMLQEMENLAAGEKNVDRIKQMNRTLVLVCARAVEELKKARLNYE